MSVSTAPAADREPGRKRRRDPLQPLTGVIQVTFYLALAWFLFVAAQIGFFSNRSFGWNGGSACVDIPEGYQRVTFHDMMWRSVTTNTSGYRVCATPANHHQAFWGTLANGLAIPFFLIAFGLTSRLLTIAARHGVYKSEVVTRVRFLAWFLVVGEVATVALRTVGSVHLYNELVPDHYTGTYWTPFWHVNWGVLLIGLVLLTLTRILREGVGMREDLEGTV